MDFATELRYTTNLDSGVQMTPLKNSFLSGDQDAHRFIVSCFRSTSRQPVDMTGAGVTGYFIRADQSTVVIDGKVEDNCAVLTLPAACYAKEGRFSLVIKASLGDVIHTILWAEGAISQSHTGAIIDPGEVVPTLDELLAQIAAMEIATNNANNAADKANKSATDATNTANAAATQAVEIATAKGDEAVQVATDKGNEAVQIATEQVEAQNQAIAKIATDLLTKAPAIECEASGSLVTVTDAAAQPAVQLISHIEPVQEGEGDPSPDNVRAISGWDKVTAQRAGKNLLGANLDLRKVSCVNGIYTATDGDTGSSLQFKFQQRNKKGEYLSHEYIPVSTPGFYKLKTTIIAGCAYGRFANNGHTSEFNIGFGLSLPEGTVLTLSFELVDATVGASVFRNLQIEVGDAVTPYEPYQSQTITADLPETVYGGTVDWGAGVMTVKYAKDFLKNLGFTYASSFGGSFYAVLPNYTTNVGTVMSDIYTTVMSAPTNMDMAIYGRNNANSLYIKDSRYTNVDAFVSGVGDHYIVYSLAAPYTIQLTPQQLEMLKGTNNVWSDTGDTSLVYVADSKMYIDNKFAELEAAILSQGANV